MITLKRPCNGLPKDKFYLSFGGALQNAVIARHWDWGHREFTHVNDQVWMSIITQRVPCYAMVSWNEHIVLISVSTCTHYRKCAYSLKCLRVLTFVSTLYSFWCFRKRQTKEVWSSCRLYMALLGYYLTLHLRGYHISLRITKFFLSFVSHSYCRHCCQLTLCSVKIFWQNVWS